MSMSIKTTQIACLSLISGFLFAIDNNHFYRASNFFPMYEEPRIDSPGLMSLDFTLGGGATSTGLLDPKNFNASCVTPCCGNETNILNICGSYNMQALGLGVPCKDPENPLDAALINLEQLPTRGMFGHLAFQGSFSIFELNFFATQNFNCGLFFQAHVPVRRFNFDWISYTDCSPNDDIFPDRNTPAWQTFLGLFDEILARYGLTICPWEATGAGDTSLLLGWTRNYNETEVLDYFDFTVRAGVLLPTGRRKNLCYVFSLPFGYDGHIGFPISCDLALGIYEWLTIGFHWDALPFLNKVKEVRVKTDPAQQGPIKLATSCLCVQQGTVWDVNAYLKADHVCSGFSFLLGYTYAQKDRDVFSNITQCQETFCPDLCDFSYGAWNMHTIHLLADIDSARCYPAWGPHISFFFNGVVGGKNVFKTPMAGIQGGINILWTWY